MDNRKFLEFVVENIEKDFELEIDDDYITSLIDMYNKPITKKKIPSPKNKTLELNRPKSSPKGKNKAQLHKCERIPKNRTTVCGRNARNEVDGKWYCGTEKSGCYRAILNKLKKEEGTTSSYPTKSSYNKSSPVKNNSPGNSSPSRSPVKKDSPNSSQLKRTSSSTSNSSPRRSPVKKDSPGHSQLRRTSPYPSKSSYDKKPKTGLAGKKEEKDIKSKALSSSVTRTQKTILRGITIDDEKYYHNPKLNVVYDDDKNAIGLLSKDRSSIDDLDDETERILASSGATIKRIQRVDPDDDEDSINLDDDEDIDIHDSEDDIDANITEDDINELDIESDDDEEDIDDIDDE